MISGRFLGKHFATNITNSASKGIKAGFPAKIGGSILEPIGPVRSPFLPVTDKLFTYRLRHVHPSLRIITLFQSWPILYPTFFAFGYRDYPVPTRYP